MVEPPAEKLVRPSPKKHSHMSPEIFLGSWNKSPPLIIAAYFLEQRALYLKGLEEYKH